MKNKKKKIEYFLGSMVGEYIVSMYLPTLSTDMICSSNIIQVDEEDTTEFNRIEKEYRDEPEGITKNEKWDLHLKNMRMLSKKYLPHELKMRIPKFGIHLITDMEQFKEGLSVSLWNCDMCSYHTEHDKIEITETERRWAWCDYVTLHLDLHESE